MKDDTRFNQPTRPMYPLTTPDGITIVMNYRNDVLFTFLAAEPVHGEEVFQAMKAFWESGYDAGESARSEQ